MEQRMYSSNWVLWASVLFLVVVVAGVGIYFALANKSSGTTPTTPSPSPTPTPSPTPQSKKILSNIKQKFKDLSDASSNTYKELVDFESELRSTLSQSKIAYDNAYASLDKKIKETITGYTSLLSSVDNSNAKLEKYNSDVNTYTSSDLKIPNPDDPNFSSVVSEIQDAINTFVTEGAGLNTEYTEIQANISSNVASAVESINADRKMLEDLSKSYNTANTSTEQILDKFNNSTALDNTKTLLEQADVILEEAKNFTFTAEEKNAIDQITGSLNKIKNEINKKISQIQSYKSVDIGKLDEKIAALFGSINETYQQITGAQETIANNLVAIKSRTDNLNYAISALKKNLELNQNYNDIKTFFNSLYPGGTPPPINIGTSGRPENQPSETPSPPPFD